MNNPVRPSVPTPFAPYTLQLPQGAALPLVCDSPHSGTMYPEDFRYRIGFDKLRSGEDTDIHVLWDCLPSVGATLLAAQFPRTYIDPNREPEDIDPGMLDGAWPVPLAPGEKTRIGHGLIWRIAGNTDPEPIYDRLLSVAEVKNRIATYHTPYHEAMREQIEAAYARFGAVWHLNLHSMPANAYESLQIKSPHPLADFVLGDRDGTTCAPEFTQMVAQAFKQRGFSVAINDPYKGVALIARLGRPRERRHSLQIEMHRGLYMNEKTRERSSGFNTVKAALGEVAREIASYIKEQLK
jgi:N-formylglutamate deformylase